MGSKQPIPPPDDRYPPAHAVSPPPPPKKFACGEGGGAARRPVPPPITTLREGDRAPLADGPSLLELTLDAEWRIELFKNAGGSYVCLAERRRPPQRRIGRTSKEWHLYT